MSKEIVIIDFTNISTEELRKIKKQITEELSKRHKAKEDEKCNCWTCEHCFYDSNAHINWPRWSDRGDYKCMACSKHGKIIPTKHKAPAWCPKKKGEIEVACYTCVYAPYAPACDNCLFDSNYIRRPE